MIAIATQGVYTLAARAIIAAVAWQKRRKGEWSPQSINERHGLALIESELEHPIWIHAASVGEVRVGRILAEAMAKNGASILISAMTETGYELARREFPSGSRAARAPFDLPAPIERFIKTFQPAALVIVETELWPNMLSSSQRNGIPVYVVNGRISDKAFPRYRLTRWFWRHLLQGVERCYMRSTVDAERIVCLGAKPDRVEVCGSLKEAIVPHTSPSTHARLIDLDYATGPVWIAGSTRPGEEDILLAAHRALREQFPNLQLWLAPRHPDRFDEVARLLDDAGVSYSRWTTGGSGALSGCEVMLIDTMGVLNELYVFADIAFVGGSLRPYGGHNPLEPALVGTMVIFGPHMESQSEIAQWLQGQGLATQVDSEQAIIREVSLALGGATQTTRESRAEKARSRNRGETARIAREIVAGARRHDSR